ncbi:NtaA/DmoA family FMN-dependent monooxygenase [Glycomyces sp. NRRL B-16210]|uniref:NtaA/DmoA family FMN-dependent monooxygenase n=1 Tax=Glycomyces sp. NRRL B-16210 TaxID=1463821 RepID=UPI00068D5080|nr:NtaA/DmoA family FMN-dependent monooxygenase [Glycomyces sp. NRRL B-16210]
MTESFQNAQSSDRTRPRKQIHLGAHFPGVNNTTVWSDPDSGSQIEFSSFVHLAQTAERGLFDFFFLAEGLRLREHRGRIHDLDVVGRPDTFTVLNALAAVTDRLGLAGTVNTTFNEPYELARQFASLDHLSGGRAAWNAVTSPDAFTGENFRRGGYLERERRYERAAEIIAVARLLWDAWAPDAVEADPATGRFLREGAVEAFAYLGAQFDVSGTFNVPRSPQGHPVIFQAGDSDQGREFGASHADVIFSRHTEHADAKAFYADVKDRLGRHGREERDLLIMPGVSFVLGDTEAEARENAEEVRRKQVGPQTAIAFLEQVWGQDLSHLDPDGPVPEFDPETADVHITRGRVRHQQDQSSIAQRWKAIADAKELSIRELVIETTARLQLVGTPASVAAQIDDYVQGDAVDGFILVPHLTPGGLDRFVDEVVPILQERGSFRTEYTGTTLRDHLGLAPAPTKRGTPQ